MLTTTPATRTRRLAVVEDHLLQRERTVEVLHSHPEFTVVHTCETQDDFVDWLQRTPRRDWPELLILDLVADRGPSASPRVTGSLIQAGLQVLVLSAMTSPRLVREMLRAGVHTVVGKRDSEQDIVAAVEATLAGESWTTPDLAAVMAGDRNRPRLSIQEEQSLILYASGLTLAEVAASLGVKEGTAKQYLKRVKAKYAAAGRQARTRLDLNKVATDDGYLD